MGRVEKLISVRLDIPLEPFGIYLCDVDFTQDFAGTFDKNEVIDFLLEHKNFRIIFLQRVLQCRIVKCEQDRTITFSYWKREVKSNGFSTTILQTISTPTSCIDYSSDKRQESIKDIITMIPKNQQSKARVILNCTGNTGQNLRVSCESGTAVAFGGVIAARDPRTVALVRLYGCNYSKPNAIYANVHC